MSSTPVGEIPVLISGDFSALADAIDSAERLAQQGAQQIADAFNIPDLGQEAAANIQAIGDAATVTGQQMSLFGDDTAGAVTEVSDLGGSATATAGDLTSAADAAGQFSTSVSDAAGSSNQATSNVTELGHSAEEAESKFTVFGESLEHIAEILGIGLGLEAAIEGLKEFASEAVASYAEEQKLTIGLTNLVGSAEKAETAVHALKAIADESGIVQEEVLKAGQRLTAFMGDFEKVPEVLRAAADASAATGNEFDSVAQALGRVSLTGQVSARQLVSLGLSWQDLANQMGVSIGQAQELLKKGGQSAEADLDTLLAAIKAKYGGAAEAVGQGLEGIFNTFKNHVEDAMQEIGKAVEPMAREITDGLQGIVPAAIEATAELSRLAAVQLGELTQALKGLKPILDDLASALGPVTDAFKKFQDLTGSFQLSQFTSDLINYITHWRDLAIAIDTAELAYAKLTGNAQAAASAQQRLADIARELAGVTKEVATSTENEAASSEKAATAITHIGAAAAAANKHLKEHLASAKGIDTTWATVPDHATAVATAMDKISNAVVIQTSKFQLALDVYAKMKASGTESAQALVEAYNDLSKAATTAGISHDKLANSITEAVAKESGANTVWVNGKEVLVGLSEALQTAGDTAHQVVVPAFQDAQSTGQNLTDTITVLTGTANAQSQAVGDLADHWVFANGQWTSAADLIASVIGPMDSLTAATEAAASAAEDAAGAYDSMAESAGKVGKSGGSASGGNVNAAALMIAGLTAPFGIESDILGGERDRMAQALASMTGQVVQTSTGTFYPQNAQGQNINPATGQPFLQGSGSSASSSSSGSSSTVSSTADSLGTLQTAVDHTAASLQGLSNGLTDAASQIKPGMTDLAQQILSLYGTLRVTQDDWNKANDLVNQAVAANDQVAEQLALGLRAQATGTSALSDVLSQSSTLVTSGTSDLAVQIEALYGTLRVTQSDFDKANALVQKAVSAGDVVAENLALGLRAQATGTSALINFLDQSGNQILTGSSTLAGQIEALYGTLRVNQEDWNKANDLVNQAIAAHDINGEQMALNLRDQATGNAFLKSFSGGGWDGQPLPSLANLGIPLGGTLQNPVTSSTNYGTPSIMININGAIYGQQGAQMVGQELTNALRTIAGQRLF